MSIQEDILTGKYDKELNEINEAVSARYKLVRSQKAAVAIATVSVGSIGVLTGLSPKKLNGREVEVLGKKQKRISVKFTKPMQLDSNEKLPFTIPAQCFVPKG